MKIITLHSGATMGEIAYPQLAHIVDMTDAEAQATVAEINRQIIAKTGDDEYDAPFAIWTEVAHTRGKLPIQEFIDLYVNEVDDSD